MTPSEITDLIIETAGVERLLSDIFTGWDYLTNRDQPKHRFLIDGTERATTAIRDTLTAVGGHRQIEGPHPSPLREHESRLVVWVNA